MAQRDIDSAPEQETLTSTSSATLLSEWQPKQNVVIHKFEEAIPSVLSTSKFSRLRARWSAQWRHLGWRLGVITAFCISIFVLIVNVSLLIVGGVKHGGYINGIGTLDDGDAEPMKKLGLTYHVLINILSTALLTSSNYCMQILSAPSREELDVAHAQKTWLDIGIISFRNLAYINRRRMIFWCILGLTSFPLHLLYNSAVFGVTTGQDYSIYLINASDVSTMSALASTKSNLTNRKWASIYDTQYVPSVGDLYLIIDQFCLGVELDLNNSSPTWSYFLTTEVPGPTDTFIPGWPDSTISVNMFLNPTDMTYKTEQPSSILTFNVTTYDGSSMPQLTWPDSVFINASTDLTWKTELSINDQGWLSILPSGNQTPGYTAHHVAYAFSTHVPQSSSIQIARVFMVVVVICNLLKTVAIFFTLGDSFSRQILTLGDAVSSYLKSPDLSTLGACILDKKKLVRNISHGEKHKPAQWRRRRVHYLLGVISNGWITYSILFLAGTTCIVSLAIIFPGNQTSDTQAQPYWTKWGTSSPYQLGIASGSFNSKTILLNAWLANTPQTLLSFSYFAINRLCTSMCFAREWNSYGTARKGLRTTNPTGQQRSTYFLQLPYRWSIPLIVTSGFLHWLLSQSLFLVRLEIRDLNGQIIASESRCNCGYSPISVLTFCLVFLILLLTVLGLLLRQLTLNIPAPAHCSLAISAACAAPVDDVNPQLKPVGWGVVRRRFGGDVAHCSFASEEVTPPVEGRWYC